MTSNLEFLVDTFGTNVHALGAFKDGADRVAGGVLGVCAEALEEREREGRRRGGEDGEGNEGEGAGEGREMGMRGVLRGLSRVI